MSAPPASPNALPIEIIAEAAISSLIHPPALCRSHCVVIDIQLQVRLNFAPNIITGDTARLNRMPQRIPQAPSFIATMFN